SAAARCGPEQSQTHATSSCCLGFQNKQISADVKTGPARWMNLADHKSGPMKFFQQLSASEKPTRTQGASAVTDQPQEHRQVERHFPPEDFAKPEHEQAQCPGVG